MGSASSATGADGADKSRNLIDVDAIQLIDDVDGSLRSVGNIKPPPLLIDPQYVYSADASGNSDRADRIDRAIELYGFHKRHPADDCERQRGSQPHTTHEFRFHSNSPARAK